MNINRPNRPVMFGLEPHEPTEIMLPDPRELQYNESERRGTAHAKRVLCSFKDDADNLGKSLNSKGIRGWEIGS